MAGKKISQLTQTVLLTGAEYIPIVQPVADPKDNRKVTIDDLMAMAPVQSVNGQSGAITLSAADVGAVAAGANISIFTNDAGYITDSAINFSGAAAQQIPYVNSGVNGFSYSSRLSWDNTNRRLIIGTGNTNAQGTDNYIIGNDSSISAGNWNHVLSELGIIQRTSGAKGVGNNALISGVNNVITVTSSHPYTGTFNMVLLGGSDNSSIDATQGVGYGGKYNILRKFAPTAGGLRAEAAGDLSWAHGDQETLSFPPLSTAVVQNVLAEGRHSFNFSSNNASQTVGHGALAQGSVILGTLNGHVPADATRSMVLSGNGIKARAGETDQVYVPNFNIVSAPSNDDTLTEIMARVTATGQIKYRTSGSIAAFSVVTSAPSTSQNDLDPTGWSGDGKPQVIDVTPTATIKITGLSGGANGRLAVVRNTSTDYLIILTPQDSSSSAANRFALITPIFLMPGEQFVFIYDSTLSKWAPANKAAALLSAQFDAFEEFHGNSNGVFRSNTSGTGASTQQSSYLINTTEKPYGAQQADTGTTTTGRAYIGMDGVSVFPALNPAFFLTRVAVEALSDGTDTFKVQAGFITPTGSDIQHGAGWEYEQAVSVDWRTVTAASSVRTKNTVTGFTVDTNYVWLGVFANSNWTRIDYLYSTDSLTWNIVSTSHTANIPSSSQATAPAVGIIKSAGTNQRNISIDMIGCRYGFARG